ncbi:Proteophosphoglycan 5 [Rhodotorula toruloides]|nr:Proteophosphoglycan 5 [Rhodotorula toruloides]
MLDKLPNELLLLIIRLALPSRDTLSPKAAGRRQALLMSLSRINKRLCSLARPHLLQSILVGTPRQARLISTLPKTLREQVETVVFSTDTTPIGGLNPYAARAMPVALSGYQALDALAALTNVKHARFYDFGDFVTEGITFFGNQVDFDLSAKSPLSRLDSLYFSNCSFFFINRGEAPVFRLVRLAFVGRILIKGDGLAALLTPEALPRLQSLRITRFQDHRERGWDGTLGADLRRLPKLVSHTIVVQVDASCESDYLPSNTADRCRLLYHLGYSSPHTRPFGGAHSSTQFIRLDAVSLDDASYLLDRISELHDLRAAFIDRAIHPDTIKPEKRGAAFALLYTVKQTPAEIIWTGSDDHAFLLPEFERYMRERQ